MSCIFCEIARGEKTAYIVYESEQVIAFLDSMPINEGHVLVVPKKHFVEIYELPETLLTELMTTVIRIEKAIMETYHPDGCTIMQNGGRFNDIGHLHFHIIPRYEQDGFGWTDTNTASEAKQNVVDRIRSELYK